MIKKISLICFVCMFIFSLYNCKTTNTITDKNPQESEITDKELLTEDNVLSQPYVYEDLPPVDNPAVNNEDEFIYGNQFPIDDVVENIDIEKVINSDLLQEEPEVSFIDDATDKFVNSSSIEEGIPEVQEIPATQNTQLTQNNLSQPEIQALSTNTESQMMQSNDSAQAQPIIQTSQSTPDNQVPSVQTPQTDSFAQESINTSKTEADKLASVEIETPTTQEIQSNNSTQTLPVTQTSQSTQNKPLQTTTQIPQTNTTQVTDEASNSSKLAQTPQTNQSIVTQTPQTNTTQESDNSIEVKDDQNLIIRKFSIKQNDIVVFTYPGKGWFYLGEKDSLGLIEYKDKKLNENKTVFNFLAKKEGTTLLHFYKMDTLNNQNIDDYVEITIEKNSSIGEIYSIPEFSFQDYLLKDVYSNGKLIKEDSENNNIISNKNTMTNTLSTEVVAEEPEIVILSDIQEENKLNTQMDYFEKAKQAFDNGEFEAALENINNYLQLSSEIIDEALYLKGSILESNSSIRNIRNALSCYEQIVNEYPLSEKWIDAKKKVQYIKHFYFNIM